MNRESRVSPLFGMSWQPLSRLSTTLSNPQHSPVFGEIAATANKQFFAPCFKTPPYCERRRI